MNRCDVFVKLQIGSKLLFESFYVCIRNIGYIYNYEFNRHERRLAHC